MISKILVTGGLAMVLMQGCGGGPASPGFTPARLVAAGGGPSLSEVAPASGPIGTAVRLHGSGFAPAGNLVRFGDGYVKDLPSADGTTLRFEVPESLDRCPPGATGPCPGAYARLQAGRYDIAVLVNGATSNRLTFIVTER